jgi:hypothetical protein
MKKRHIVNIVSVLAVVVAAFFVAPMVQERVVPWKFVVCGDSRGTDNGINSPIVQEMADALIKENPRFVVFTGDLIDGSTNYEQRLGQLAHWRAVFARPLMEHGIKVYPIRGNHDLPAGDPDVPDWGLVFSGDYALPDNGPYWEKNITYSFVSGNALFIGADIYLKRNERGVDLSWMTEQLENNRAQHVFVFAHEPAYASSVEDAHQDGWSRNKQARDAFAKTFTAAGGVSYFCGHDDWFDHAKIEVSSGTWLHQYVVGTAGAPLQKWAGGYVEKGVTNVAHTDGYGYLVVEIKGRTVALTFKQRTKPGDFVARDTFRYRTAS